MLSVSYWDSHILRIMVHEGRYKALGVTKTHHIDLWMQKHGCVIPQYFLG